MILSKRNFLIGATAPLGIIAAPAIVRCESLMAIKAVENTRYITFLEAIYPGMSPSWYDNRPNGWCYDPGSQELKTGSHKYDVRMLDSFMCNKMITPV